MGVNVCLTLSIKYMTKKQTKKNLKYRFKSFFDVKLKLKNLMLKNKVPLKHHSAGDESD